MMALGFGSRVEMVPTALAPGRGRESNRLAVGVTTALRFGRPRCILRDRRGRDWCGLAFLPVEILWSLHEASPWHREGANHFARHIHGLIRSNDNEQIRPVMELEAGFLPGSEAPQLELVKSLQDDRLELLELLPCVLSTRASRMEIASQIEHLDLAGRAVPRCDRPKAGFAEFRLPRADRPTTGHGQGL